jgi:hypothetical protein
VYKEIKYQKPLARVLPESPIVITYYIAGIIIQVDFFLLNGIKIDATNRIKNKKNYREDLFLPSYFIEGN